MPASVSSLQYGLKSLWPQDRIINEVYPDHPFLAMIPKDENFLGDGIFLALRTADTQGRSANFGVAQAIAQGAATPAGIPANAGSQQGRRFFITRNSDYQIFSVTTEAIKTAKDEGALIDGLDVEMASALNNISKSLAVSLFRGRSGALGTVGARTATTFTLANPNDVTSFEVGMALVASASATGANRAGLTNALSFTGLGTNTVVFVSAVDRDTGVISLTGNGAVDITAGATPWTVNDTVFAAGDNANGSGDGNKVTGLADWIPSATPGATPFFGVDRSVDPTRLGGLRVDGTSRTPEEALMALLNRQCREGGKPSHIFLNHADFLNLQIALGGKVVMEYMANGTIGFEALQVRGPKGPVRLYTDQDCPAGRGYSLQMDTWKLYSAGGAPMLQDIDGNVLSREPSADRYEGRMCYYAQTGCEAPGFNATIALPTA